MPSGSTNGSKSSRMRLKKVSNSSRNLKNSKRLHSKQWTPRQALLWGQSQLKAIGKTEARLSAERLLEAVLQCDRIFLYLESDQKISKTAAQKYRRWIEQRKKRIPLDYLLGQTHFWNEVLKVGPGCLIPRPSTEVLVEKFIEKSGFKSSHAFSFLDLGCGSGAIGIAILREFPKASAVFADVSAKAMAVTRHNLKKYQLLGRSRLVISDLFEKFREGREVWDAVISNPPYLSAQDLKIAQKEVLKEPLAALAGGPDGLNLYRSISEAAPKFLKPGGLLVFEMGKGQAPAIKKFCSKSFIQIEVFKDYAGIDRVLMARLHG